MSRKGATCVEEKPTLMAWFSCRRCVYTASGSSLLFYERWPFLCRQVMSAPGRFDGSGGTTTITRERIKITVNLRKKFLGVGLVSVALVLAAAIPASAMDCVVVHRSTQGATGAAHSSQWALIDVNQVLTPCATGDQLAQVDAALTQAGLPLVFDTRTDKVLPDNGHGIQHIDTAYVPIIMGIMGVAAGPCLQG